MVGNEQGHSLVGNMERLAEEVSELKKWKGECEDWKVQNDERVANLEARILPLKAIRERVLAQASGYRDLEKISLRNEYAHGGNVLEDSMLIHERSTAERERVEYWKRAFCNLYGCRLNTVEQHLRTARPEIIEILNINANCNLLKRWDSETDSKNQILRRCNDLVNDWLFGRSPDFLQENSPSHNAYKDVIERYRSGQCFAKVDHRSA